MDVDVVVVVVAEDEGGEGGGKRGAWEEVYNGIGLAYILWGGGVHTAGMFDMLETHSLETQLDRISNEKMVY